jgi:hypothetical protein
MFHLTFFVEERQMKKVLMLIAVLAVSGIAKTATNIHNFFIIL